MFNKTSQYGIISTGNFNENTAKYYGDHCLLTTNKNIIADINHIFSFLQTPSPRTDSLKVCKTLPIAPVNMRKYFSDLVGAEIKVAGRKKRAAIMLKMNSLVDEVLIAKLYDAAKAGVTMDMVIRGICCVYTEQKSLKHNIHAISIIDEYLEHARVFVFNNGGDPKVFISSADWMVRNLDHRVEAACPIYDKEIQQELMDILNIQLAENVKGRILDNEQSNTYVPREEGVKEVRSQLAIYNYLRLKQYN